ncbi:MAG: metallophosphoesterase family protein [Isosphaeraceae bacterium]|nr:metallophosphoesterase family protein [Isosphaeraceae bacterium]
MPVFFTSDVHLRLDRPERATRFARWVDCLAGSDTLWVVGDLCDFWAAARQRDSQTEGCPGLRSLAHFRARGGALHIIAGNHDLWMGPLYERVLGVPFVPEPVDIVVQGLRVRLVHGHLLGARRLWKAWMESRTFFRGYAGLPAALARPLDGLLEQTNQHGRLASEERHLEVFRRYAAEQSAESDLVVIGHVHRPVEELRGGYHLIVLGGWHDRANYLRIDEAGATLRSEPDPE